MTHDIELEIDEGGLCLAVTYQCTIRRTRNEDGSGRGWWEPDVDSDIIHILLNDCDEYELEWFYGDEMPARLDSVFEKYQARMSRMLYERAKEIVNSPTYQEPGHD